MIGSFIGRGIGVAGGSDGLAIYPPMFATTDVLYSPDVSYHISAPFFQTTDVLYAAGILSGAVSPGLLQTTDVFYPPFMTNEFIASGGLLFSGTGVQVIAPDKINTASGGLVVGGRTWSGGSSRTKRWSVQ